MEFISTWFGRSVSDIEPGGDPEAGRIGQVGVRAEQESAADGPRELGGWQVRGMPLADSLDPGVTAAPIRGNVHDAGSGEVEGPEPAVGQGEVIGGLGPAGQVPLDLLQDLPGQDESSATPVKSPQHAGDPATWGAIGPAGTLQKPRP